MDEPIEEPVAKKVRRNIDNSDAVNLIKIEILPREILCIIFSYIDKKSLRNATAVRKLWFQLNLLCAKRKQNADDHDEF